MTVQTKTMPWLGLGESRYRLEQALLRKLYEIGEGQRGLIVLRDEAQRQRWEALLAENTLLNTLALATSPQDVPSSPVFLVIPDADRWLDALPLLESGNAWIQQINAWAAEIPVLLTATEINSLTPFSFLDAVTATAITAQTLPAKQLAAWPVDHPWLQTQKAPDQLVYAHRQTPIRLSPSSINQYLACPRQFFYQQGLGIKVQTLPSFQTVFGRVCHKLLEVFHRQPKGSLEKLLALTDAFFAPQQDLLAFEALGFAARDREDFEAWPLGQRQHLHQRLRAAFEDLAAQDFFDLPIASREPEKWFQALLPATEQRGAIELVGRADAVGQDHSGQWHVEDFKTGSGYVNQSVETNLKTTLKALEPVDWEIPIRDGRYAGLDVQLPVYWWLARQALGDQPVVMSIQVVRPRRNPADRTSGSHRMTLTHEQFVQGQAHFETLLEAGVMTPLWHTTAFAADGDVLDRCKSCDYQAICPRTDELNDSEGNWDA